MSNLHHHHRRRRCTNTTALLSPPLVLGQSPPNLPSLCLLYSCLGSFSCSCPQACMSRNRLHHHHHQYSCNTTPTILILPHGRCRCRRHTNNIHSSSDPLSLPHLAPPYPILPRFLIRVFRPRLLQLPAGQQQNKCTRFLPMTLHSSGFSVLMESGLLFFVRLSPTWSFNPHNG